MIISILENEIMNFAVSVEFTEHVTPTGIMRLYNVDNKDMAARLGSLLFDTSFRYISVQPSLLKGVSYDVRRLDYDFATVTDIDEQFEHEASAFLRDIDEVMKYQESDLPKQRMSSVGRQHFKDNVIRVDFRKGDKHA